MSALIFWKPIKVPGDIWLIAIGVTVAMSALIAFSELHGVGLPDVLTAFATSSSFLLLPSFLLLYVRGAAGRINRLDGLWLTPALLHFVLMYATSAEAGDFQFANGFVVMPVGSVFARVPAALPVIFGLVCPVMALREAKRHEQSVKAAMSSLQGVDLRWAGLLQIIAFGGASIGIVSLAITGGAPETTPLIVLIVIATQIAVICVFVVGQSPTPQFVHAIEERPAVVRGGSEVTDAFRQIESVMSRENPHLIDGLTIEDLAVKTQIPRQTVSAALKAHGQNFYDYINSWRVAEAKRLLADKALDDVSILSLAFDAGFSSKATFNRVFKTAVGRTPREFRAEAQAKAGGVNSGQ